MSEFTIECFQNEYLPEGAGEVNAIVTVTSSADGLALATSDDGPGAEVIIVDVSGSMRGEKLRQARDATIAAINCIRDGVRFAVLAGNDKATPVFPPASMIVATSSTRAEAARVVGRLKAGGGTAIGRWITAAAWMMHPERGVRHAILLTDGKNEHESPEELSQALRTAVGTFQCDCRGVGTDWSVAELRQVASTLLGSVDIVADPANLAADFESMVRQSMGKAVADARLRVWTAQDTQVGFIK
jgi:von Willebrand factor type A domain